MDGVRRRNELMECPSMFWLRKLPRHRLDAITVGAGVLPHAKLLEVAHAPQSHREPRVAQPPSRALNLFTTVQRLASSQCLRLLATSRAAGRQAATSQAAKATGR